MRACVVRVEGGAKPGAGFFVAPGLVITCMHVVSPQGARISVRLGDDRVVEASSRPVLFHDGGRPIPDLDDDYPDLALVDVAVDRHPCVAVDQEWPRPNDELQAYGYPTEGGSVLLTPLALGYTGKEGPERTPYIDVWSRTPITGGMSGGPVLSVRSGAVCAILVASRSPDRAHGGLAVSWSALPHDVLVDLVDRSARFHRENPRWERARAAARQRVQFGHAHVAQHFVGRTAELKALEAQMERTDRVLVTQAITGLGGVGKTQLAARYVQQHGDEYDVVAWIHADDGGAADLGELAITLGLPVAERTPPERAAIALAWLGGCQERWLLVLDNLPGPEDLDAACPAGGNGRVLITSRNQELKAVAPGPRVDVFDEDTATRYLIDRTGRTGEQDDARALARALGGLPLALSHAGAYCARRTTFREYIGMLRDLPPRELYDRSPEAFYRQTVASVWQPSIAAAVEQAPLARDVLTMAAFLAPDRIPLALLDALIDPADSRERKRLTDAIDALERYSLITLDGERMSVHPLLQAIAREDASARERQRAVESAVKALTDAMPADAQDPQSWPVFEQVLGHVDALGDRAEQQRVTADPTKLGALMYRAALYVHQARAEYARARSLFERALHVVEPLGPADPLTLRIREGLANTIGEDGSFGEAAERLAAILADCSPDDPLMLQVQAGLGYWKGEASTDKRPALAELQSVLPRLERGLPPGDNSTLATRSNIARWLGDSGQPVAAVKEFERLRDDCVQLKGPRDPWTLDARHGLAWWRGEAGDVDLAVREFASLLDDSQELLPPGHPNPRMLEVRHDLAWWHGKAGEVDRAVQDFKRLLADEEALLPPDDPRIARTRQSIETWQEKLSEPTGQVSRS